MRILLIAAFLGLALLAAPTPAVVEPADACQGQGCPVSVQRCREFGFHVWLLGDDYGFCMVGPVP